MMLASLLGGHRKRFDYQRSGSVRDRGPPPAILFKPELLTSTSEIRWRLAGHSERGTMPDAAVAAGVLSADP